MASPITIVRTSLALASLVALLVPDARAQAAPERSGAWTARSSTGLTLAGTWTAKADPRTGAVTGMWTLDDANGKPRARGAWSAAKAEKGWTGAWRAIPTGSSREYSGTWTATVDLKADAPFADLFTHAVQTVVSGTWRAAGQSGAWSIRASPR